MIIFSYDLVGAGWSECTLEVKNKKVKITASYLSDALGDLSMAVYRAICGDKYVKAEFTEEPGEYRWVFKRVNERITNIKIIKYSDYGLNLSDEDGVIIFEENIYFKEFVNAFIKGVTQLLDIYGIKGYKELWYEYDFPLAIIDKIKAKL